MSESVFRVRDQLLVFGAFLCVIRYLHSSVGHSAVQLCVCACICVCALCATPLPELACLDVIPLVQHFLCPTCHAQRTVFAEVRGHLRSLKLLKLYHRQKCCSVSDTAEPFSSLQDRSSKSVGKQAKMLLRKKETKHCGAGNNIQMTLLFKSF